MNLLILGGTGRVGSHLVMNALKDGHHVTALVRTPDKIENQHENLTVIQGNVLKKEDVTRAMYGVDVVLSALNTDGGTTLTESMPLFIDAMEQEGIKRIITIGTAGILQSRVSPELLRYQSSESKRKLTRAAEEHHKVYELLQQSNLDWTIVCPTYLPDGERIGNYRTEPNFLPVDGSQISVPDTADFTYSLLQSNEFIKARVGIAY
ncbi:NAD(P)-dependent oxidoreductase [Solibacillus sp. NPDC093137]|uniref:NAD(P)-dependent oxidoreductase n=1 Tax=Solibacillus sp. NPDC093137 TaxID=3390678 RepID=UPI003CFD8EC5